jgi:hypothetical protein
MSFDVQRSRTVPSSFAVGIVNGDYFFVADLVTMQDFVRPAALVGRTESLNKTNHTNIRSGIQSLVTVREEQEPTQP